MDAFQHFNTTLSAFAEIPDKEMARMRSISQVRHLSSGEIFIRAGETPRRFAFVHEGLFRYTYSDNEGHVYTKGFIQEGRFLSSYSAMIEERPSHFTVEALEDSVVIVIPFSDWLLLKRGVLCWNELLVALLEYGFSVKEAREREFLLFDAQQRYRSFLASYPGLENRVRQHLIASFLGITPESLSRIRNTLEH